ncbi:transporter substrate-binding domain-containing protein [Chitinibacter sp. SCUT-21]|uniref:substrate-binding periplasmic protein n=1 Tax=Chitinibacter sp. SCUT-21 TaxID=2970891 RepID=UPI0035A70FA6
MTLLLGCSFFALISSPVLAAKVRFLVNDVAPYTLRDETQRKGMHIEMVEALVTEAKVAFQLESAVYVRLGKSLEDGSADIVGMVEDPNLEGRAIRVLPLHAFQFVVISHKDAPIRSIAELTDKTLGVARGAFYADEINNNATINKYGIKDPFQGVKMLEAKHLDAVISSDYLLTYALMMTGVDTRLFATPFAVNERRYVLYAASNVDPALINQLRAAWEKLESRGDIARIIRRYR